MILAQINWLTRIKKTHLYLGYWVPDAPKMRYKSRFTPFELFSPGGDWQRFEQAPTTAQFHQITQRRSEPQVFFSSTES
jgi:arginyl-tRNA--protein-N-Asp/Glu arginylyltransferase